MKDLMIVGTGLFAEVAAAYFEEYTDYRVAGYLCHAQYKEGDEIYGRPLGDLESFYQDAKARDTDLFVAIGYKQMNKMRQRVYEEVKGAGFTLASFIHPGVKIWSSTTLGDNVFIFEDNTIQPFTSIGSDTVLWSGNHVGHHSRVGAHCFISSHVVISGSCVIGDNCFIGVNTTIRDGIQLGEETLVGAGSLITKNGKPRDVYAPERTKPFVKKSNEIPF